MKEFKFKLYNQEWCIKFVNSDKMHNILESFRASDMINFGFVDYSTGNIYINKDYTKEIQLNSLLHEIVHVFLLPNMGSNLHRRSGGVEAEIACSLVSIGLVELMNQGLFTFNFEKSKDNKKVLE